MKLSLESTGHVVYLDGVPCRVWQGTSESGASVVAFVHRIVPAPDADHAQFERELTEHAPPSQLSRDVMLERDEGRREHTKPFFGRRGPR